MEKFGFTLIGSIDPQQTEDYTMPGYLEEFLDMKLQNFPEEEQEELLSSIDYHTCHYETVWNSVNTGDGSREHEQRVVNVSRIVVYAGSGIWSCEDETLLDLADDALEDELREEALYGSGIYTD